MLSKLLKYEFKAVGRLMLPLYGAWLVMSFILGFLLDFLDKLMIVGVLATLIYVAITMTVVVLTTLLIIQRFYKNLLGAEGYMMFTLPVSTSSLVLCKGISAALWITAGSIMGGLSLLIITGCTSGFPDLFQGIGVTISTIWEKVGAGSILVGAEILLLFLLGGAEMALKIYAAISVGHQCGSHRILGAIGAYLGFGIVEVIVMNFLGILGAEIGIDARLSAFTQGMGTVASLQVVLLPMMASVLALGGIYYTVTYILMKNRLNLE